jgi:cytochrome b
MPKPAKTDRDEATVQGARPFPAMARVWDPVVRIFHWSLVLSFVVAWFTSRSSEDIHHLAGYVAAAVVLVRLLWGFLGTPYARFSQFIRNPMVVVRYLIDMLTGREARYIGHNPAGGMMVLALIAAMAATVLTGWMSTTDAYFGVEWVQRAHDLIAHGLLLLVFLHLGGVVFASLRHRENLIGAMISGRKRAPNAEDVP